MNQRQLTWQELVDENKRLRAALEEIAGETWNPAIGLPGKSIPELHVIARNALRAELGYPKPDGEQGDAASMEAGEVHYVKHKPDLVERVLERSGYSRGVKGVGVESVIEALRTELGEEA